MQFNKNDFHHLCGLHKLKGIEAIRREKRETVFDKIIDGTYPDKMFNNNDMYNNIIERIDCLNLLEKLLDDRNTVFKFNNRVNNLSQIKADFIIKNCLDNTRYYYFISENNNKYFGRSCFSRTQDESDYTNGHTSYTLLYKEKINLRTLEREVLYISPSYRKELEESSLASDQKLTIKNDLKALKSKRSEYISKPDAKTRTAYKKRLSIFQNRNIYTPEMLEIVADRLKAQLDDPHNCAVSETIKNEIEYIKNEAEQRRKEPDRPTEKSISIVKNQINSDGTISSETAAEIPIPNVKKISQKAQRDTHTVVGSINSFISDLKDFFNVFKKPKKQTPAKKKNPSGKPKNSVKSVDKNVSQQRKKSTEISKKVQENTPEKSVHNTPEKPADRPYFTREMLKKEAARISREYRESPRPKKEKSHSHEIE